MAIKKSSSSGIPFGNTAGRPASEIGRLYSNGETARLELYTATGWQNIIQETPGVSSITGNYLESTNSGVITISGTNFVSGAYAAAIGTNGVQIEAASTTFNSLVQLTATFTGLSGAYEPYDIKVTNPSNLFGMLPDALYVNNNPAWTTPAGSLGTFAEQVNATIYALSVSDDSTITYSLANGSSLPSGVTLSSNGVISGTPPDVSSDTTYTFTVNATDGLNPVISRTFSFVSNAAPVWVTSSGSLGAYTGNTTISTTALSITDTDSVTYTLASGSALPSGLALNASTGVISGTLPVVSSSITYSFVINVNDGVSVIPRSFSITAQPATSLIELLVVGGGGGGGSQVGGGGGAGGLVYSASYNVASQNLVTIGTGGAGGPHIAAQSGSRPGNYGANTVFGSVTAFGGGGGGGHGSNDPASGADGLITQSGRPGGSGGGGGANSSNGASGSSTQNSPSGTTGYGFAGGTGTVSNWSGGGGGGAGGTGANSTANTGGAGGAGRQYSITGTSLFYAAGGGGCGNTDLSSGASGGSGIGGDGKGNSSGNPNTKVTGNGATNTGSGGGGARDTGPGGDGGSGVVLIAYPDTFAPIRTIPGTLTYDQPTRAGYRVYRFTAGTGTITI